MTQPFELTHDGGVPIDAAHPIDTSDRFNGGQVLADVAGGNASVDFAFTSPVDLVWVRIDGGTTNARVDPFGGVPTSSAGIIAEPGIPVPITVTTSTVKVWIPTGATCSVHGYRY